MLRSVLCIALSLFAVVSAQSPFQKYTITAPGISASFIPYGARLTNLIVNDKNGNPQDIALGYDNGTQYLTDTETVHTYFGPIVGYDLGTDGLPCRSLANKAFRRYANRIKNGTFTIKGVTSHVPENEHNGADTLHGGFIGYDQV